MTQTDLAGILLLLALSACGNVYALIRQRDYERELRAVRAERARLQGILDGMFRQGWQ